MNYEAWGIGHENGENNEFHTDTVRRQTFTIYNDDKQISFAANKTMLLSKWILKTFRNENGIARPTIGKGMS